jgi:hypothetical protein
MSRSSRRRCAGGCPDAQRENIGETPTHVVFIELKEAAEPARGTGSLGTVDR